MNVQTSEIGRGQVKKKPGDNLKPYWFKPGQSGNPSGGQRLPEWFRDVRALPKHTAARAWSKWLSKSWNEIEAEATNKELSALEAAICRAILSDIEKGEIRFIELGLSRIMGKIPDAPIGDSTEPSNLSPNELAERVQKALSVLNLTSKVESSIIDVSPEGKEQS